ncbi:XRE family transcriptional regulator [Xylanimonas allomyrinae]|uniref:XRE family transcriptional regulator n=1 Tax=Xylanimonas allomyrinae TaxID=2509459 RepID=A0A4P6ENA5_9MICO|nr:helix-turn-helix transcriptional regulator [Xylanimonas allomyrinae]QAY63886.1 XRE family transcriptional regulator [Xylanimonas allomyrinae]
MSDHASTDQKSALASFGADLRELRTAAGNPTYEAMARKAGLSLSLLSTVDKGRAAPSRNALRGYLVALGRPDTEVEAWLARREQLHAAAQDASSAGSEQDVDGGQVVDGDDVSHPAAVPSARPRSRLAATALLLCVVTLVSGFAVGRSTAVARSWWPGPTTPASTAQDKAPRVPVSGTTPMSPGASTTRSRWPRPPRPTGPSSSSCGPRRARRTGGASRCRRRPT